MSKKKTKKRLKIIRGFLNDELAFVREKCPHLVTVAASLLPFRDALVRFGTAHNEEGQATLVYDIAYPRLPDGVEMIAQIDERRVVIRQCVKEGEDHGGDVLTVHVCDLPAFWEFLRTIPRGLDQFGQYVTAAESSRSSRKP